MRALCIKRSLLVDDLYSFKLSRAELEKINKGERAFFFALGHVANEINILSKQTVWCDNKVAVEDYERKAQITLSLFNYRMLAGKLNEANELIRKLFLSKPYSKMYIENFDDDAMCNLTKIKKYFGSKNIVNIIRNNHAFHYSQENYNSLSDELPDEFEMFMHKSQGNSLFYASEEIAFYSMMKSFQENDLSIDFGEVIDELIGISKVIMSFCYQFINCFVNYFHKSIVGDEIKPIEIKNAINFLDVSIPWYVEIEKA
jgi:hypothetical protein